MTFALVRKAPMSSSCDKPRARQTIQAVTPLMNDLLFIVRNKDTGLCTKKARTGFCRKKSMRKVFFILLMITLSALGVRAQTVQDSNYRTVAHIKSDGTLQDSNYRTIGHIKGDGAIQDSNYKTIGHLKTDGTVQDANYRTVGHIKSDGTVQDSNYKTVGHVKQDGTVQDSNYKTIGHAQGIPMAWAALYFFFL